MPFRSFPCLSIRPALPRPPMPLLVRPCALRFPCAPFPCRFPPCPLRPFRPFRIALAHSPLPASLVPMPVRVRACLCSLGKGGQMKRRGIGGNDG